MADISVAEHRAQVPPLNYAAVSEADVGDYVALLKPRVMSLVVFTASGKDLRGFVRRPEPDGRIMMRFWDQLAGSTIWEETH